MALKVSCLSIDCPERRGDACQFDLDGTIDNFVRDVTKVGPMPKSEARHRLTRLVAGELRAARQQYDVMEFQEKEQDTHSWRQWKGVRNVLTDRIEILIGKRA